MACHRAICALGVGLTLVALGIAQTASNSIASSNSGCNGSLFNANASAIFTYPVQYPLPDQPMNNNKTTKTIPDPSWAITVEGGNGREISRRLWYDTAGQNYADDLAINYDVCAFAMTNLPLNTVRLGQRDSGNCSTMFSESCIKNMTDTVSKSASMWTQHSSPPPHQNLTAGVLPTICNYIHLDLQRSMTYACQDEFQIHLQNSNLGVQSIGKPLTGLDESGLYDSDCTRHEMNKTFHSISFGLAGISREQADDDWSKGTDAGYDNATADITPVLTVYTPVANANRTSWYSWSPSNLQCLRASNIRGGSRVSPPLANRIPAPKLHKRRLSFGAIGGIAAGVSVFVLAVNYLLNRWIPARGEKGAAAAADIGAEARYDGDGTPVEVDGACGVQELTSDDRKPELDSDAVVEMDGGHSKPAELRNTTAPAELPAT